jgi:uncharacterized protein
MIVAQCVPYVLRESTTLNTLQSRLHGLDHWWRIWRNAQLLVSDPIFSKVDMEIVGLYALFHDSMRLSEGKDIEHGHRGYKLFERMAFRVDFFKEYMTQRQSELFFEACVEHSQGQCSIDPTIAVCWDADRLDLHRKGIFPDPHLMSTEIGIQMAMDRVRTPNSTPVEIKKGIKS